MLRDLHVIKSRKLTDKLLKVNYLKQLEAFKTRDSVPLDWFFTNRPELLIPKVVCSNHVTVLCAERSRAWLERWCVTRAEPSIGHEFQDSLPILSAYLCEDKFKLLMSDLNTAIDVFIPPPPLPRNHIQVCRMSWLTQLMCLLADQFSGEAAEHRYSARYKFASNVRLVNSSAWIKETQGLLISNTFRLAWVSRICVLKVPISKQS